MNFTKILFLGAGWLSLGIAGIGIIFPFLPITMPFLLVAAWAFGKSSPEMRERIRSHNTFGPYVSGWQDGRIIPLNAKIAASVVIAAASVYLWVFGPLPKLVAGLIILGMVAAEIYILGRPIK
jgi:uncharacterized membrane protein YbaN (DUF454 family)